MWMNASSTNGDTLVLGSHTPPGRRSRGADLDRVAVVGDAGLHLGPEVADEPLDGPGGGVPQGADGVALDLSRLRVSLSRPASARPCGKRKDADPLTCLVTSHSMSISSTLASPAFMRSMMSKSQDEPSRHGVHCPHDSCL